jgi:hypothetical protein
VVLDFMGHDPANFVDSERALLWMIKSRPCGVGKSLRRHPVAYGSLESPQCT